MNDRELERRVARWLHAGAEEAPASLRESVVRVPVDYRRTRGTPSLAALGAIVTIILAIMVSSFVLFKLGPQVGGRACTPDLIDQTEQALANVDGYTYLVTGSASVWHGKLDPIDHGAVYEPKPLAFEGSFQAPDRVTLTLTEGVEPPMAHYPPLQSVGLDSVIRIGGRTWLRLPGSTAYGEGPMDPQTAGDVAPFNPLLALLHGRDELPAITWSTGDATVPGAGGCVLSGTQHGVDADQGGDESYLLVVRIDDRTGLPSQIRERLDYVAPSLSPGSSVPRPAFFEFSYEVDYAQPTINPPAP